MGLTALCYKLWRKVEDPLLVGLETGSSCFA